MSYNQNTDLWQEKYHDIIDNEPQQTVSALSMIVENRPFDANIAYFQKKKRVPKGDTNFVKKNTRFETVDPKESEFERRQVSHAKLRTWEPQDIDDLARQSTDPRPSIVFDDLADINRQTDREIISAITGTAYGYNTGVTFTFPSAFDYAVDYKNAGSTTGGGTDYNLTYEKLRDAQIQIRDNEVSKPLVAFVEAGMTRSILNDDRFIRDNYKMGNGLNIREGMDNVFMEPALGITFVLVESGILPKDGAGNPKAIITTPGSLIGMTSEIEVKVDELGPEQDHAPYIYIGRRVGYVRYWDDRTVLVACETNSDVVIS